MSKKINTARGMIALDIVVPAYQEALNLKPTAASIQAATRSIGILPRILIINDGSTDGTGAIADQLANSHANIKCIHQANQGVGGAISRGFEEAAGDYVMVWPADMLMHPDLLSGILQNIGSSDILVGYRSSRHGYTPLMKLNSRIYAVILRMVCGLNLRDFTWICIYRRALLKQISLKEKGVAVFPEILLAAYFKGATFSEIELRMQIRQYGKASASQWKTMRKALMGLFRLCKQYHRLKTRQPTIRA